MLNYKTGDNTCITNLMNKGIAITDKNSLKAGASMIQGLGNYQDGAQDIDSCVMPKEVLPIFRASKKLGNCVYLTKSFQDDSVQSINKLTVAKDATLSLDKNTARQQIRAGRGVYPVDGCVLGTHERQHVTKFIEDTGKILSYENDKVIYQLQVQLQQIINECAVLDQNIVDTTSKLNALHRSVADQRAKCNSYRSGISYYVPLIEELKKQLEEMRLKAQQLEDERRRNANSLTGRFMLRNPNKNNLCMDDGGGTQGGQTKFHLWGCDTNNQNQHFTYDPNTKQLRNPNKNNLCMDDGGGTSAAQTQFHLWPCDPNNNNQKFDYDPETRMFKNPTKNNLCVDDGNGQLPGQTKFILWHCDKNNANQIFERIQVPNTVNIPQAANNVVSIYQHCNYQGWRVDLPVGRFSLGQLATMGFRNDDASSIRFLKPARATLYEHDGFQGRSITLTSDSSCLVNQNFNDMLSSIVIEENSGPVVSIFQHCNYGGWKVDLMPGSYNLQALQRMGFVNDDASAIKFVKNGKVTLFEHDNFRGRSVTLTSDTTCLVPYNFNDVASSIIVD